MQIIRLYKKWAEYKEGDLVIVSNYHSKYLIDQDYAELIAKCPSFNNRLGGKGIYKMLPLTNEKIDLICKNLDADIRKAKRMMQKLHELKTRH